MRRILHLLLVATLYPAGASADGAKLDAFLSNLARDCTGSGAYDNLFSSLYRYTPEGKKSDPLRIPSGIKPFVGRIKATRKGDHTLVELPITGLWRGLAVKALRFQLGHDNGIGNVAVVFTSPLADVVKNLERDVVAAQAGIVAEDEDSGLVLKIDKDPSEPKYLCGQW